MLKYAVTMKKSAFWFTLVPGTIMVAWSIWELRKTLPEFLLSYLSIGCFIGIVLGLAVSFLERSRYIRSLREHGDNSLYKTTAVPNFILPLLAVLVLLLDSRGETGYVVVLGISGGVYLLFLSIVIFRIRNNMQILIT